MRCYQSFKDTEIESNSQRLSKAFRASHVVISHSKILNYFDDRSGNGADGVNQKPTIPESFMSHNLNKGNDI